MSWIRWLRLRLLKVYRKLNSEVNKGNTDKEIMKELEMKKSFRISLSRRKIAED